MEVLILVCIIPVDLLRPILLLPLLLMDTVHMVEEDLLLRIRRTDHP